MVLINGIFPLVNDMVFLLFKFVFNIDRGGRDSQSDLPYFKPILGGRDTKKVEKH